MIYTGQLDLKLATVDTLNLPSETCHSYSDSGRGDLIDLLSYLAIQEGDAIIDFGCGKGGALMAFSECPFAKITGIDISNKLVTIAKNNLSKLKITNAEVFCCDAKEFNMLDDYNYVYFFNPFPCSVMRKVMENIQLSLSRKKRELKIIYLNPECHDIIIENGLFCNYKEIYHTSHVFKLYRNCQ